jgi:murein DD-endopeptidase MepM/ murein hydrolase activator NlpD
MLSRRRVLLGGAVLAGAAAVEPLRRLAGGSTRPVAVPEPPAAVAQESRPQAPGSTFARLPGIAADGPQFAAVLSRTSVRQGGTIRLRTNVGQSGTARIFGRTYPLLPAPTGGTETYLPLGVLDPPGATAVAVEAANGAFNESASLAFLVEPNEWAVEYLTIPPAPPGEANPLDPVAIRRENELLATTYAVVRPERFWVEPWIIPMQGVITSQFGEQRSINGGPVGGHHGGADIATPFGQEPGAPIHAANHGEVVLSERLIVRGNMVVIDHGAGVFTGYAHMDERYVQAGDFVAQGDLIGKEGATGLVTGAHLHWEVAVGGVLVDGLRWVDGSQGF